MDEQPESREYNLEDVRRKVESDPNSPERRAGRVLSYLATSGQFTTWDVFCFACEYIGSQVATLPWISEPAKALIRLLYLAHYFRFNDISWLDQVTLGGQRTTDAQHENKNETNQE